MQQRQSALFPALNARQGPSGLILHLRDSDDVLRHFASRRAVSVVIIPRVPVIISVSRPHGFNPRPRMGNETLHPSASTVSKPYSRVTGSYSPISHPANNLSPAALQLVKLT